MKILLINIGRKAEIRIPQGLHYLASAVQSAGHTATLHDETLSANHRESLEEILSSDADIIGLSVYSIPWQLKRAEDISRAIKTARKSTLIIWGGWHATLYPRHSILNENVDIVVRGPGEKPVCDLLEALEKKRTLKNIPALVIKENNKIIETGPECLDPQYLYPPLDFKLIDLDAYLRLHDAQAGILQYITSRGCHGRCRFCVMSGLFKGKLVHKPKEQIISELQSLLKNHKITSIHFSDDNAFRNDAQALEFCDILEISTEGKSIPWRCATRIDTLSRLSCSTYEKLVASSCKGFVIGIESGTDRVLHLMRKGITVSQINQGLKSVSAYGFLGNLFFFLFNFPGETEKEARETLRLARKTRMMFPCSNIHLNVYSPALSDSSWLEPDISPSQASRLSEIIAKYDTEQARNYRVGRINILVLRFYFGASKRKENNAVGMLRVFRNIYKKLIHLRIKYGIFSLPFEYYLSNTVIRKIRKILGRK